MNEMPQGITHIIGIDEVGRGPLAGPVTVCAFAIPAGFDIEAFVSEAIESSAAGSSAGSRKLKLTDSKGLNEKSRQLWNEILDAKLELKYSILSKTAQDIDAYGISACISSLVSETLAEVMLKAGCAPHECRVYLDGGLKAPKDFEYQSTHIKGDALFPVISFASIRAKVHRDAYMEGLAASHPAYGFEVHKGYGTLRHRTAIKENGLTDMHRKSFCGNIPAGIESNF